MTNPPAERGPHGGPGWRPPSDGGTAPQQSPQVPQPSGPQPSGPQPYGQPPPYGPPQYGQPPPYGPPQYGAPGAGTYGPPPYGQPPYGPPPYGQPPYGPPPFGQSPYGPPGGAPAGAPPRKSRTGLILALSAAALVVIAAAVVLPLTLGGKVLDRAAVQRDVAAQFEQRDGVKIDLLCPQRMKVTTGATYRCTGTTARGERVTLTIRIANADTNAYTWSER